jgi:murein L,D-transpeptidase YcbB/YkuD
MQIKDKIKHIGIGILCFLFFSGVQANNNTIAFNDVASTVIMNTLEHSPKEHFLKKLYSEFFFLPLWVEEEKVSDLTIELFEQIRTDRTLNEYSRLKQDMYRLEDNLKSSTYPTLRLVKKMELEFKISQLYKGYADYTLYGSINWGAFQAKLYNLRSHEIKAAWLTYKSPFTPVSLLVNAVMDKSLTKMFHKVEPQTYHFSALKKALYHYQDIAKNGGWQHIPFVGVLRVGNSYGVIPQLRERLHRSGDDVGCKNEATTLYDSCLQKSVIHFQKRHGLVAKGVVGKETLRALNVPIEKRIVQIKLNLDRIKWLHHRDSKYKIMINIPSFTLYFEENNSLIQKMRVITGKRKNPTPIFSNTVKTIVLNPYWNIPKSIIQKEMIPKLLKNPDALASKGIEIRSGWGKNAELVDPYMVDWGQYQYSKVVPFRFAQVPGYSNALGKVKFLFPNQFAVYMHDTPNKRLFQRSVRAFSHGCIRLQKPRELLKTFAMFNENVNFEKSQKILKGKNKSYLKLNYQTPVDVVYLTAYVDYSGILQFRNDIYGYDKMQLESYREW